MPERKLTVFIYLPGETIAVPAGIFTHDNELSLGTFVYGRRYLMRDNCLPVDPVALPLGRPPREVIINGGLYGSFRDAVPDYWGRLVIAAEARAAPEAMSEIDFLLAANATRTGNLDFRLSPEDPEPELVPPGFNRPSASASSIIIKAILSFVEFPGLKVSYLANTKQGNSAVSLFSFTKGVLPIVSNIFFA